jgi:hypothetical protein
VSVDVLEEMGDGSWDDALLEGVTNWWAVHCVGLATGGLPVGHDGSVAALQD